MNSDMTNDDERAQRTRLVLPVLALVTLLALTLRLTGLGHGLPHAPEPDAFLIDQIQLHQSGEIQTRIESDNYGKYPHLLSRIFALLPAPAEAATNLEQELEQAARPFLFGRLIVALLSSCLIPLSYGLARRFLTPWWSLGAATFVATSLLHISFSQQARPHGPLASFTTLALLSLFALLRHPTRSAYLRAGLACGLAIACLHNGAAILIPALVAHLLVSRGGGLKAQARALLPLLLIALLVIACYPFLFPSLRAHLPFAAIDRTGLLPFFPHAASNHWSDWVHGAGFGLMLEYLWSFDPALLVLLLGGVLINIKRHQLTSERRRDLAVAASFVVPYVLVLGLFDRTYERFLLPLLPFVACFAAAFLHKLSSLLRKSREPFVGLALVLLAQAFPLTVAIRSALQRARPDPATQVAEWVTTELDPKVDRIIVSPIASFPLPFDLQGDPARKTMSNHAKLPWPNYQAHSPRTQREAFELVPMTLLPSEQPSAIGLRESRSALRKRIQNSHCNWVILRVRPGRAMYEVFAAVLSKLGTRVARFSAREDGQVPPDRGDQRALQVLRRHLHGPSHDIYRLKTDSDAK